MNDISAMEEASAFFDTCLAFNNHEDVWATSSCRNYDFNVYDIRCRMENEDDDVSGPPINCDILELVIMKDGSIEYNTVHSFPPAYPEDSPDEELHIHQT